jgi:hypothetical protein
MASGIAHDFNTALMLIMGSGEILLSDLERQRLTKENGETGEVHQPVHLPEVTSAISTTIGIKSLGIRGAPEVLDPHAPQNALEQLHVGQFLRTGSSSLQVGQFRSNNRSRSSVMQVENIVICDIFHTSAFEQNRQRVLKKFR